MPGHKIRQPTIYGLQNSASENGRARCSVVMKALCYKTEGREFETQ
jgi:hypothetical protein